MKSEYNIWQNIKYITTKSSEYNRCLLIYYGSFSILAAIQPFILIFFPRYIIDELTGLRRPQRLIILLSAMFLLSSIINFVTAYLKHISLTELMKVTFRFIHNLTEKNLKTDYKNTEDSSFLNKMESANRSLYDVRNGLQGIIHSLFSLIGSIISFLGFAAIIARLNILILLLLVLSASILYFLTIKVKKYEYSRSDSISENDRRAAYASEIMYDFAHGKDLRIYNLYNIIINMYKEAKGKQEKIHKDIKLRYFEISIIDILLILIRDVIVYAYLIYLFLNHIIRIGEFTMYLATIAVFSGWMQNLMNDIAHIRAQNLYISDLRRFLEPSTEKLKDNLKSLPKPPYTIEFRNVTFKYPNDQNYIFKDLSIIISAKQKLAIVGHNGAGKTTFVKLLCRLYDPDDGEILINSINIKEFSKEQYFTVLSSVFQEIKIFAFSVAENIALKEKETIDYEKINECIEKSDIYGKILSLKNGVHTNMLKNLDGDGIEFSGGESQKVVLARALYKNADIVVLDEPTAALDALAEYNIYKRFNNFTEDKTAIYISHRLSSTRFCDKIAFIENGQLVEYGTHKELLSLNGKYAKMFEIQAQYYKD